MTAAPGHDHSHGSHSHGLVDASIKRSREGVRAVGLSLFVLGLTAAVQVLVYLLTDSVALLADLIHNAGDAATAIPLGIAFLLRSLRLVHARRDGRHVRYELHDHHVADLLAAVRHHHEHVHPPAPVELPVTSESETAQEGRA